MNDIKPLRVTDCEPHVLLGQSADSVSLDEGQRLDSDNGSYFEFHDQGFSIFVKKETQRISSIHFYGKEVDGYKPFTRTLPHNFKFGLSRKEVLSILGDPSAEGGNHRSKIINDWVPLWIRYDFPDLSLHCRFSRYRKKLEMLTLMTPDAVPQ